ncbi:MAG: hypothetical protein IJS28_04440 [Synergistaceae bacterium]|nr:hypothetical protein [Synergistaceae bacterium]
MSEEIRRIDRAFDVYAMFPEAARRAEVLENLKRSWPSIVGNYAAGKRSQPYNLGVNELWVRVDASDLLTRSTLARSKGGIARKIAKQFGYDLGKDFVLNLTDNIPVSKTPAKKQEHIHAEVVIDEEKVRQYMQDAPETLPEDINYAISRLQVFLEERAEQEKTSRR